MKTQTCSHTPGPWENPEGSISVFAKLPWMKICDMSWQYQTKKPVAEAEANARLIAAAPQMLAALQSISDDCLEGLAGVLQSDTSAMLRSILGTAQDAISDATGK